MKIMYSLIHKVRVGDLHIASDLFRIFLLTSFIVLGFVEGQLTFVHFGIIGVGVKVEGNTS